MSQIGKRELNRVRKRAEIVDIATAAFFDHGYDAVSMSAIAEQLGGSKATLWAHFSSKEELFAAVLDQKVESFAKDIDEVLTSQSFSFPALRRACLRFIECILRDHSVRLHRLLISEGERFPEINEMFYERGPARFRSCIHKFFETSFTPEQSLQLTQVVVSAMLGYRADLLMRPERTGSREREEFVDCLIGLIDWPAEQATCSKTA